MLLALAVGPTVRGQVPAAFVPSPDSPRDLLAEAVERVSLGPPGALRALQAVLGVSRGRRADPPADEPLTLPDLPAGFGSAPGLRARSRPADRARGLDSASFTSPALTAERVARARVHAPAPPPPEAFRPSRLLTLPESPALLPLSSTRPQLPPAFLLGPSPPLALRSRILEFDPAARRASRALVIGIEIGF